MANENGARSGLCESVVAVNTTTLFSCVVTVYMPATFYNLEHILYAFFRVYMGYKYMPLSNDGLSFVHTE